MGTIHLLRPSGPAAARVITAVAFGATLAVTVRVTVGWWYAGKIGWTIAATTYVVWTWTIVGRFDGAESASMQPGRIRPGC